jgi:molecular chaperone DnaJ
MAPQREWFDQDYYKTLGIPETATAKEISTAYRKLAQKYHPDTNQGDTAAEEKFKEITAAYTVLGDAEQRSEYDEVRKAVRSGGYGPGGFGGGFPNGAPGGGFGFGGETGDISDLLSNLFGGSRGGGGRPPSGGGAGRPRTRSEGTDLETEIHISLLDAMRGVTTSITIPSSQQCPDCGGNGAAIGTHPRTCDVCNGKGTTQENQGLFGFSRPCSRCNGKGSVVDSPCQMCQGSGAVSHAETVTIRVPEGIESGKVVRVGGKGGQGPSGARGDLYVRVQVQDDKRFTRDGVNLRTTVPILFTEAALGATIEVATLEGDRVKIKIAAGTRGGKTLRVRGRGMPSKQGKGDLLVTTSIVIPGTLTPEQREALEAFAAVYDEDPRR